MAVGFGFGLMTLSGQNKEFRFCCMPNVSSVENKWIEMVSNSFAFNKTERFFIQFCSLLIFHLHRLNKK